MIYLRNFEMHPVARHNFMLEKGNYMYHDIYHEARAREHACQHVLQ